MSDTLSLLQEGSIKVNLLPYKLNLCGINFIIVCIFIEMQLVLVTRTSGLSCFLSDGFLLFFRRLE